MWTSVWVIFVYCVSFFINCSVVTKLLASIPLADWLRWNFVKALIDTFKKNFIWKFCMTTSYIDFSRILGSKPSLLCIVLVQPKKIKSFQFFRFNFGKSIPRAGSCFCLLWPLTTRLSLLNGSKKNLIFFTFLLALSYLEWFLILL